MTSKKYVLITGASTGIGKACALFLDNAGFDVFAGVRNAEDGDKLCAEGSERLRPLMLDVTDDDLIAAAVQTITGTVGDNGLAGLVNNAGIGLGGPLEYVPLENIQRVFDVNVMGTAAVTQALLPLIRQARGRVVIMSSLGGKISAPFNAPYSMSKYALEAYGDALRRELAPAGIPVALVEPGAIDTPIWDKTRERIMTGRDQWPEGFEERYGKLFDHSLETFKDRRGISPDYVAKAVHHALTAPRPKIRYVVGMDARILFVFNHWLPDRWMDRLFRQPGKSKAEVN